jgi:hypothetical protein
VRRPSLALAIFVAFALAATGCSHKPTMRLNHAEISGVQLATFPPGLGVAMKVVVDVNNPNSFDLAIRALRGQVVMAERYTFPLQFPAPPDGVWLPAGQTTPISVTVTMPAEQAIAIVQESMSAAEIPYRFSGRADVTATRTFQIAKDDYSIEETGTVPRQKILEVLPNTIFGPR